MASQPGWPLVPDAAALAADELRDARVFTVNDRQILVMDENNASPFYSMIRKWVRNEPETDMVIGPQQAEVRLPPLPPADASTSAGQDLPPAPKYPADEVGYEPEVALQRLREHWVSVREHHQTVQAIKSQRAAQRLKDVLAVGAAGGFAGAGQLQPAAMAGGAQLKSVGTTS